MRSVPVFFDGVVAKMKLLAVDEFPFGIRIGLADLERFEPSTDIEEKFLGFGMDDKSVRIGSKPKDR